VNTKNPKRRPRPSYEARHLRDPSIERKIDPTIGRDDLHALIKNAVQIVPKPRDR